MTDHRDLYQMRRWQSCRRGHLRGFTLIELIMVIVMLGVLAVFAAPRMLNTSDFYARGFHDETLSFLRYAQKAAIAQRRMVCVTFDATSVPNTAKLTIASAAATSTCNTSLTGPNKNCPDGPTGSQGCITAPTGVAYQSSLTPSTLSFDGLGTPTAMPLTVQVASGTDAISKKVTIEAVTGYVHD